VAGVNAKNGLAWIIVTVKDAGGMTRNDLNRIPRKWMSEPWVPGREESESFHLNSADVISQANGFEKGERNERCTQVEGGQVSAALPYLLRDRSEGVLKNYLLPTFGELCLRDLTPLSVQKYFSNMAMSPLAHESRDKIRDVLSSVLASAVKYEFLVRNPVENVRMPAERRGKR
jgi:hypothetical protein